MKIPEIPQNIVLQRLKLNFTPNTYLNSKASFDDIAKMNNISCNAHQLIIINTTITYISNSYIEITIFN